MRSRPDFHDFDGASSPGEEVRRMGRKNCEAEMSAENAVHLRLTEMSRTSG
ncbi:MAG: hypothetical protein LBR61_01995 [Synergistaceae bacterium]|nr:hypothetical protein [Synergistaceae bacterium]